MVDYVCWLTLADIPDTTLRSYKRQILDAMTTVVGSLRVDGGRIPARVATQLGGPPDATIVGHGIRVGAANAAFANAQMSIALDLGSNLLTNQGLPGVAI